MTATAEYVSDGAPVEVGKQLLLRSPGTLVVRDEPHPGWTTRLAVATNGKRLTVYAVAVEGPGVVDGNLIEVTGTDLRAVRVRDLVRTHLPQFVIAPEGSSLSISPELRDELRSAGPSNGRARRTAADLYNFASALGLPPAKYVQDQLGLSPATASRWIKRVRELGWLDDGDN